MTQLASSSGCPETSEPLAKLTVRVGCHLVYETLVDTPMLLDVQPHLGAKQVLRGEKLEIGNGLMAEPIKNSHDNRLVRLILPP